MIENEFINRVILFDLFLFHIIHQKGFISLKCKTSFIFFLITVAFICPFVPILMQKSADSKIWLHMGKIEITVNQS